MTHVLDDALAGGLVGMAGRKAFRWTMAGILLVVALMVGMGLLMAIGHTVDWDWTCARGEVMVDGECLDPFEPAAAVQR